MKKNFGKRMNNKNSKKTLVKDKKSNMQAQVFSIDN